MKCLICSVLFVIACGKYSGHPDRLDPDRAHNGSGSAMDISAPAGASTGNSVGGTGAAAGSGAFGQPQDAGTDAGSGDAGIR